MIAHHIIAKEVVGSWSGEGSPRLGGQNSTSASGWLVSKLIGALNPVNHRGLHQG